MKMITLAFLSSLVLLSACAGLQSTYKPSDFSGGYGDEKLKENTFMVYFDGNGFTTKEIAKKYFLRHSAEVTLRNGQKCFKVIDEKSTLSANYMTKSVEALNSKYYYKNDYELIASQKNIADENSLSGIIQLYPETSTACIDAKTTLETTSLE
jgi:hypothetical protein